MDASLVLEDFFSRSYNLTLVLSFIVVFFQMVHNENLQWEGPALSIGPFHKVQHEVIYFSYSIKKNEESAENCPKIVAYFDENREISGPYNFWTLVQNNTPDVWNWNWWTFFVSEN